MPEDNPDDDLEEALDGLITAADYADMIAEYELAEQIANCYQELAQKSPDESWTGVYECSVIPAEYDACIEFIEQLEETMIIDEEEYEIIIYTGDENITKLKNSDTVIDVIKEPNQDNTYT